MGACAHRRTYDGKLPACVYFNWGQTVLAAGSHDSWMTYFEIGGLFVSQLFQTEEGVEFLHKIEFEECSGILAIWQLSMYDWKVKYVVQCTEISHSVLVLLTPRFLSLSFSVPDKGNRSNSKTASVFFSSWRFFFKHPCTKKLET